MVDEGAAWPQCSLTLIDDPTTLMKYAQQQVGQKGSFPKLTDLVLTKLDNLLVARNMGVTHSNLTIERAACICSSTSSSILHACKAAGTIACHVLLLGADQHHPFPLPPFKKTLRVMGRWL
eukprot:974783-Pelagomonas_calceolata.AAC.1